MSYRAAARLLALALVCGLCPPAPANTTAGPGGVVPSYPSASTAAPDSDADSIDPPIRIGLLLPSANSPLAAPGDAVRAGFLAAHEREPDHVAVSVLPAGATSEQALAGYNAAVADFDIIVGPLARRAALAVARAGRGNKPTVLLNALEGERHLRPGMLPIGLSLEAEARQAAEWAAAAYPADRAVIVHAAAAWQRRTAQAFARRWKSLGRRASTVEFDVADGAPSPVALARLKGQLSGLRHVLLFAALSAEQARVLRAAAGPRIPLFGTTQLNPFVLDNRATEAALDDLDGVRLLDMPWLLQPDHPAVMVYPHPVTPAYVRPSPDLARLYALGVDAYRIARALAHGQSSFALDGVTGKLQVRVGADEGRFDRRELRAVYRDGKPQVPAGSGQ